MHLQHLVLLIALMAAGYCAYGVHFWMREGRRLQAPGYLPPPPSIFGRTFLRFGCRLLAFIGVGPITVVGSEHCQYAGRLLVTPNHQFELDFAVVGSALPFAFRQLASAAEVRGWRGAPAAFTGHFAVHVERGKSQGQGGGQAVVEAAAGVLQTSESRLLYFLQGYLDRQNQLKPEDFRTGGVRALQAAAAIFGGADLAVLPIGVHYKGAPTTFLAKQLSHRHIFGISRFGANVVIGKPIPLTSLPADVHAATEVVRQEIARLVEQATQLGRRQP